MRAIVQRLALVGFGLFLGCALLEGALRLAAVVLVPTLNRTDREADGPPAPDDVRVLCVGDSHTYGVGVAPDETYPVALQSVLRARGVHARVVNAGVPGMSSTQLRERLPRRLAEYHPQIVIVWVGANNQWRDSGRSPLRFRDHVRLLRFLKLLLRRYEGVSGDFRADLVRAIDEPVGEKAVREGRALRSVEETTAVTQADLEAIVATVRAAGATPLLVTYPVPLGALLRGIDTAIVAAGAATGATVVDVHERARRYGPGIVNFLLPDLHPKPVLYHAIAWQIARTLVRGGVVTVPRRGP